MERMQAKLYIYIYKVKADKFRKIFEKLKFENFVINLTRDTPSNGSDYLWQIWK